MVRWPNQSNLTATTDIGHHGKQKEQPPVETYVSRTAFTVRGHQKNRSLSNLSVRQETAIQRYLTKSEGSLPSIQLECLRLIIEDDDRRLLQWITDQKNLFAILELSFTTPIRNKPIRKKCLKFG